MRVHGEIDTDFFRSLIRHGRSFAASERFEGFYRLANKADVKVEANAGNVARLLGTEHVTGTTHLQVLHGYCHACTKVIILSDGGKAVIRGFRKRSALRIQEVGIAALTGTTHAPTQLV